MERARRTEISEVIAQFDFPGSLKECIPFGSGHINDTYRLTFETEEGDSQYILQRMNRAIFTRPVELMENICRVTDWLRRKIEECGGDVWRETPNVIPAKDGRPYCTDSGGEYWRAYYYITGATSYDMVKSDDDFYESAVAFGHFQQLLADYPAETLHETIPKFHDTVDRFAKFDRAVNEDVCGRAASVAGEIRFVVEREPLAHVLCDQQASGELPTRVTHNDTKLNNVLIDDETGKAICVIDLDTVMPGLSVNDFGDSIRFGASMAAEDERDLDKVSMDLHLYEVYVKGFLKGCAGALTQRELEMLPMGAIMMTFESGIRFLTDHLEGDHYFKIHREGQNLDRARTQLRLVADMERKLPQMREIVEKYARGQ